MKKITQCDRVYIIAFGEGAQHLHLHLIPRFIANPNTKAWSVADHYRSVDSGESSPVFEEQLQNFCSECSTNQGNIIELLMKPFTRGLRANCLWVTNGPVKIQKLLKKIVIGKKGIFIIAILNPHFAQLM